MSGSTYPIILCENKKFPLHGQNVTEDMLFIRGQVWEFSGFDPISGILSLVNYQNEVNSLPLVLLYPPYPKDRGMLWFYVEAARRPQWC